MIDPSIWDDEGVGMLSDSAFRLFIACLSYADDEGKLEGSPRKVRAIAFRFKEMSLARIGRLLDEIAEHIRGFYRYTVDGRELIALLNWNRYQRVDKPQTSSLPDPPDAVFVERSQNDLGTGEDRSSHEGKGKEREVQVEVEGKESPPPDLVALPPDDPLLAILVSIPAYPYNPDQDAAHLANCIADYPVADPKQVLGDYRAWRMDNPITKKSRPRAQLRTFFRKAQEWAEERTEKSKSRKNIFT